MNDDQLLTAMRESFTDVHSTTPAAQIVKRGRTVRARHRVPGVAAVGAVAVAVGVGVTLPAGHPAGSHLAAGHPASRPGVQLAAWTVRRQVDGDIQVTFREATDATGLQQTLRADGVPASVTFSGQQNPTCEPYSSSGGTPTPSPGQGFGGPLTGVVSGPNPQNPAQPYGTPYALVVNPAALPSGAGLEIWTSGTPGATDNFQLQVSLVQASPQCTGS